MGVSGFALIIESWTEVSSA